jgi:hypothetical protein
MDRTQTRRVYLRRLVDINNYRFWKKLNLSSLFINGVTTKKVDVSLGCRKNFENYGSALNEIARRLNRIQ